MSKKWYGSLDNRLEENKMYCEEIKVGTGMTEYSWSDRNAYEVVKVVNQKDVFVREYDHIKKDDKNFSNDWELVSNKNNPVKELKFRNGSWKWVNTYTKDSIKKLVMIDKKIYDKVMEDGIAYVYTKANVSFGVADYYYDYEF